MGPNVHVDAVLVLEAFAADAAVMKGALLSRGRSGPGRRGATWRSRGLLLGRGGPGRAGRAAAARGVRRGFVPATAILFRGLRRARATDLLTPATGTINFVEIFSIYCLNKAQSSF